MNLGTLFWSTRYRPLELTLIGRLTVPVVTVKLTPLLATPPTVTTTLPVAAPVGTGAVMLDAVQLVGVAAVPLNLTVLVPWVEPKFVPVIVTEVPTEPEAGFKLVMLGGTNTRFAVKLTRVTLPTFTDVFWLLALNVSPTSFVATPYFACGTAATSYL